MEHTHDWVITKDDFERVCARCYECESVTPLEEIERILNSSQQSVHTTLLQSPQEYEAWLRAEFERMGFEFKPQSG